MELKCPQCGKWMAVSQEELVIHDCQVVCPQCLAVCQYEGGVLVVRDDSDAPYRHNATVETAKAETAAHFCYSCGKQLPEGISFCPYCGADLNAPFEHETPKKPEPAPAAVKPQPKPAVKQEAPAPAMTEKPRREEPTQRDTSTLVEDKLRTVTHQYRAMHPHIHQNGTMPSATFKFFAYAAIILLLILLVYIIIAGSSIETTTM